MNNTDLYNFKFVDRKDSYKTLEYIIDSVSKLPLILGKHGVGKTYFIKYFIKKRTDLEFIQIEFQAEEKEQDAIKKLIMALEEKSSINFFDYFKVNYKYIFRMIGNSIIEKIIANFSTLCDILKNSITVKSKDGYEKSVAEVLYDYLIQANSEEEKIVIVFDNFHLCDKASLETLIPFIKKCLKNHSKFSFIISITLEENEFVKNRLEESIPREKIEILKFDDYLYFYEILFDIIDISDKDYNIVNRIYEFCDGNPEQLRSLMHKFEDANALLYSEKSMRAEIDYDIANKVLDDNSTYIPISELSIQQKFVIFIIIEFGALVPYDLLNNIVYYVMSKTPFATQYDKNTFIIELFDLLDKGIITLCNLNDLKYVKMEHDLKFNYYKKALEVYPFFDSVSLYLFEYLLENKDNILLKDSMNFLLPYHSYKGNVTNWQTINLKYGLEIYNQKDYLNATKIFSRFQNCLEMFTYSEKLTFVDSFYKSGNYDDAKKIIEKIDEKDIPQSSIFSFLYLKAKIYKFCLSQVEAENIIDKILSLDGLSDLERISMLSLEERIFANSANERKRAFDAFKKIKKNFAKNMNGESIYGSCLKTSIEFYRGKRAQDDLKISKEIARKYGNQYELGAIYTNEGFDLFWQGEIDNALSKFKQARDTLLLVAEYEVSYPLNNLANCYILKGDYDNAVHYLKVALYWNKSSYVKVTLNILLAYCLAISEQDFDLKNNKYFNYILENLKSPCFSDISIQIKCNYLISCIYEIHNQPILAQKYKMRAFQLASNHNPEYLPYIWMQNYNKNITADIKKRVPRDRFPNFYIYPFDPWLVTLSHD